MGFGGDRDHRRGGVVRAEYNGQDTTGKYFPPSPDDRDRRPSCGVSTGGVGVGVDITVVAVGVARVEVTRQPFDLRRKGARSCSSRRRTTPSCFRDHCRPSTGRRSWEPCSAIAPPYRCAAPVADGLGWKAEPRRSGDRTLFVGRDQRGLRRCGGGAEHQGCDRIRSHLGSCRYPRRCGMNSTLSRAAATVTRSRRRSRT